MGRETWLSQERHNGHNVTRNDFQLPIKLAQAFLFVFFFKFDLSIPLKYDINNSIEIGT